MAWLMALWSLRLLITLFTLLASFKALKKPATRQKRAATIAKELEGKVTLSSADRARRRAVKAQLTTWTVWITFCMVEKVADRTISWIIPLYDEGKVMGLLFILAWRSAGAELVFKKLLKPIVTPYERPIDAIGFLIGSLLDIVSVVLLYTPRWIGRKWLGAQAKPDIPSIMMSLKVPNRPPLSKKIASSIESAQAVRSNPKPASQQPITHPRRAHALPSSKPVPTSRLASNSDRSLSATTSQYPTIASTRVAPSEFAPSTSSVRGRIPSSSRSRLEASISRNSNLYPKLPTPNAPVEYDSEQRSSNREALRHSVKGKERQFTGPSIPSLSSSDVPPLPNPYKSAFNPPNPTSTRPEPPREPSPPPFPFQSPPPTPERLQIIYIEPPTPLPPGAFHSASTSASQFQPIHPLSKTTSSISLSSKATQKPLRNPSVEILSSEALDTKRVERAASPREKVSSALLELSRGLQMESIDLRSPSLSPIPESVGRKRGRKAVEDKEVVGSPKKKIKVAVAGTRKGRKVSQKEEDDYEVGKEEEDEGESTATESILGSRKKAAAASRKPSTESRTSAPSQAKSKRKTISSDTDDEEQEEAVEFQLPISTLKKRAGRIPITTAATNGPQVSGRNPTVQELNAASQLRKTLSASTSSRNLTSGRAMLGTSTSTSTSKANLAGGPIARNLPSYSNISSSRTSSNTLSTSTRQPLAASTASLSLGPGVIKKSIPTSQAPAKSNEKGGLPGGVMKKPRRVLLGASARGRGRGVDEEEVEMEGVPLVRKR